MTLLAVSQRTAVVGEHEESRDTLDQRLVGWLQHCGYLTAAVPNYIATEESGGKQTLKRWVDRISPLGFLLSGGEDPGVDPSRDELEFELLGIARDTNLPVLGICRGMQVMAVWAGASLEPVEGHAGKRHRLVGARSDEVNSFHRNAVVGIPNSFGVTSQAVDGVIESIVHKSLPWQGWMWHPEREQFRNPQDRSGICQLMA